MSNIYSNDGKCYGILDTITEEEFNSFFNKYDYTATYNNIVGDCESKAKEERKEFFLIGNSQQLGNDFRYSCYIPKIDAGCSKLELLFKPFTDLIDTIFGIKDTQGNRSEGINITTNHIVHDSSFININPSNEEDCFKLTNAEEQEFGFGKNNKYTLYQSTLLNSPDKLTSLATMRNINDYNTEKETVFNYENDVNYFYNKIREFIIGGTLLQEVLDSNLNDALTRILNRYNDIYRSIDNIEIDLNLLNEISLEYSSYFRNVQESINNKKRQLHEYIGLDGGNNERFNDTRKMKNILLSEIIILLLIIIFSVYINSKKK